jgi:hypothetical protein
MHMTKRSAATAFAFCFTAGVTAVFVACSAEPATKYGTPAGLSFDKLPGEAGIEPLACDGGFVSDAGPDACGVSWRRDIFPRMTAADGGWQCASGPCHGPSSKQEPIIVLDASAALADLKAYSLPSRPADKYIATTKDPNASTIECNLGGTCGVTMPIGTGRPLTNAERCAMHAWLACGAPDN